MEKVSKHYLYHMVPSDMQGDTLHPLTELAEKHPDLYIKYAAKYRGREHVTQKMIATLDAGWNDVLHLSPIPPAELKKALVEAGMAPEEMRFYQIDPELLDPEKTTIYLYHADSKGRVVSDQQFTKFEPTQLAQHAAIPDLTKARYREDIAHGHRPLLFVGIPHVLHKGSIDVSNLPVIIV